MARYARRWLAVIATGVAAIVLAITIPTYAAAADISDEDDCTMALAGGPVPAELMARCTR
jgi:hypothetical protein